MLESCGTPCGPRQHAGRGQFLHRALLVFEVSALSSRTEGKTSFFFRRHADVMKTSTSSLRTLRATFPAIRNMTWHGTRSQLSALRYVTLSMHHICADGFPGYESTRTCLYSLHDFETDDDGFSLWVLSWVSSPRRRLTRHRTDLGGGMNVVPASRSSPVSTFISMSLSGRGNIIGVLVLTNCCSVVLVPAPYEEFCFFRSTVSWCVGGADDCNSLTLLFIALSVPGSTWPTTISSTSRSSYWSCCFSLLHIHVVVPCASRIGIVWHVRPSFQFRFAPWDFVSFSSGTLHYTRCVQQPWTSPASFWRWWTRSYLSSRFRKQSYVLDVDLANVLGVVVVKLKQGFLVLTCWSYSRYFFTRLFRRRLLSGPHSVVFVRAGSWQVLGESFV